MKHINSKRVLIVEDSADLQELLSHLLAGEGHQMFCAGNGKEALDILRAMKLDELPDIILLDLMMPEMDGFEFREIQLNTQALSKIPVVVMTADSNANLQADRLQAQQILKKPVDLQVILSVIDAA